MTPAISAAPTTVPRRASSIAIGSINQNGECVRNAVENSSAFTEPSYRCQMNRSGVIRSSCGAAAIAISQSSTSGEPVKGGRRWHRSCYTEYNYHSMITFSYQARDASGKIVSGIQDALNEDNAVTSLM